MPSTGTLVFNDQKLQAPEIYVTESLGVGVSVPTSNLEVVGNAYVSSNLEVVGRVMAGSSKIPVGVDRNGTVIRNETGPHDRPLTKYPEIAMTANSSGGYVASASTTYNNNGSVYVAFNEDGGTTSWQSQGQRFDTSSPYGANSSASTFDGIQCEWLQLQLPRAVKVSYFKIIPRSTAGGTNAAPEDQTKSGSLYGSNDGSVFTKIMDYGDLDYGGASGQVTQTVTVNASVHYKYLRLTCTARYGNYNNQDWVGIGELEYYGTEEGDVSTDLTLSSVYNKPGTEHLEVYYDGQDYTSMPSTITDKSGNGVTGTPTNVTFDSTWKAFSFDGSGDYIEGTLGNPGGDYVHSVSWWFKPTQTTQAIGTNEQTMWFMGNTWGAGVCSYSSFYADTFYFAWHTYNINCPTTNISQQQWNHACVTYTGGGSSLTSRSIYINGVKQYSSLDNTQGQLLNLPANTYLLLGNQRGQSKYFNGSIANFRLFSKALNAEQVKELYDYQKDYFLGSRSSLTIHKGNLGLGVAEPTSRLEIAGNERIQEYPPRAMTGHDTYMEGHGVFRATASSEYNSTFKAFRAFIENIDNSTSSFWHSQSTYSTASGYNPHTGDQSITAGDGTVYSGEWIQLSMPYQIHLKRIGVSPRTTNYNRGPHTATLLARRNGGDDWVVLTSWGGLVWTTTEASDAVIKYIEVNSEQPYSEFVMVVHLSNDSVNINRMKFFGTPAPSTLDDGHLTLGKQLTTPRVSGHAAGAETPRAESLVVHYDTTVDSVVSGATVVDTSGSGNNGTFNGGAAYSSSERAFSFDGSGDYIVKTGASGLPTGDAIFTVSAWINILPVASWPSGAQWPNIITYGSAWAGSKLGGFFVDTNLALNGTVGSSSSKTASGTITPNTWQHVVAVKSGTGQISTTTYDLYVDGVKLPITGVSGTNTLSLDSGVSVSIGGGFTGVASDMFTGKISNPKMWDVALTADEIAAEYALGRTGKALNVTDTAVCLGGTAPRAQLDVRGSARFDGHLNVSSGNNNGSPVSILNGWKTLTWSGNLVGNGTKSVVIFDRSGRGSSNGGQIAGEVTVVVHRDGLNQTRAYAKYHVNYSHWYGTTFYGENNEYINYNNLGISNIQMATNGGAGTVSVEIACTTGTFGQYYIKFDGPIYIP